MVDVEAFCAVVAVADARHRGRAAELARRLAEVGNVPLTVLESGHDRERSPSRTGVVLADGDLGPQVVEHATGRDGAIVVLEAFGGGPPGDRLFDADAEVVLTRLRHPVLVLGPAARVPPTTPTPVVALDAGAHVAAAAAAARWQVTFRSPRPLVVALDPPDPWPDDGTASVEDPARRAVADLARHGIEASLVRRVALDPATAVLESAELVEEPVVVVAAPRWPGGPSHWFSTARRLIRRAGCPVLVVPADVRT
jgi:nucleotide-binding universal stress UspA family protein